jgi:hypothetical protein
MHRRRVLPLLTALVAAALVLTTSGESRQADVVTCSSTSSRPNRAVLTGSWTGNDGRTYAIRQVGTCVWWVGSRRGTVESSFFGSVSTSGSAIFGFWANVPPLASGNGRLIMSIVPGSRLLNRGSTGAFPTQRMQKTRR